MSADDEPPEVPVVCPECDTTASVPLPAVAETIEAHNDSRHGGEQVARVDPALAEQVADLAAEDLGLLD